MTKPFLFLAIVIALGIMHQGCGSEVKEGGKEAMRVREINEVKRENTERIMAIPGVVGLYIGANDDGTKCIVVMVAKREPELEKRLPTSMEGYPVRIEETGEIKPMK